MSSKSIPLDVVDDVTKKAYQLSALLNLITGEGLENFLSCNDLTKDNYLWVCRDLSESIEKTLHNL